MQRPCLAVATETGFLPYSASEPFENRTPAWGQLAIKFSLLNFSPPKLIRYTIILLSGRACADVEPHHSPHKFRNFANLLVSDSAAKLSYWSAVNIYRSRVDLLPHHRVTELISLSGLPAFQVYFPLRVLRSDTNAYPPFKLARLVNLYNLSRSSCRYTKSRTAVPGSARSGPTFFPARSDRCLPRHGLVELMGE